MTRTEVGWKAVMGSLLLLLLVACSGPEVERSHASRITLPAGPTYAFAPTPLITGEQPPLDEMIRRTLETALESKGFRPGPGESADLLVEYRVAVVKSERHVTEYTPDPWRGPVNIRATLDPAGGFGPPPGIASGTASTMERSLEIVLRDRPSGRVFYQAACRQKDTGGQASDASIERLVTELLEDL